MWTLHAAIIRAVKIVKTVRAHKLELVNFVTGAAVLAFELVAARVVAPYIGTSIYIWTSIIGVILAALAIGYYMGGKLADIRKRNEDVVLLLISAAAIVLLVNIIKDHLLSSLTANDLPLQWQALIVSIILFAPTAFLLGMVSPYLARLNITELATSGQRLASVSAWGTAGSIFGTFLTGYVLFGYFGTKYLLAAIAATLIAVSFVMSRRVYLPARIVLFIAALANLLAAPPLLAAGTVAEVDTRYSRATVRDVYLGSRQVRVLQTDGRYWQSGIYTDGDKSLVFPYTQIFYEAAKNNLKIEKVLVIGGGAFTFPQFLADNHPEALVDVVEIDGGLIDVSRQYFNFNPPNNLRIIVADGRQYLNTTVEKYDLVYLDAFSSVEPPFQLFTMGAAQKAHDVLKPNGYLVANVISAASGKDASMLASVNRTYRTVFNDVDIFQAYPGSNLNERQNFIVVAGQASNGLLSSHRFSYKLPAGTLLTDDYAPVERMSTGGL